jgi:hypothetical protein
MVQEGEWTSKKLAHKRVDCLLRPLRLFFAIFAVKISPKLFTAKDAKKIRKGR